VLREYNLPLKAIQTCSTRHGQSELQFDRTVNGKLHLVGMTGAYFTVDDNNEYLIKSEL